MAQDTEREADASCGDQDTSCAIVLSHEDDIMAQAADREADASAWEQEASCAIVLAKDQIPFSVGTMPDAVEVVKRHRTMKLLNKAQARARHDIPFGTDVTRKQKKVKILDLLRQPEVRQLEAEEVD
jgi:hypothetical protein